MSITYTISRLSKPFKKDLKDILEYEKYERYCIYDEEDYYTGQYIRLFKMDDPHTENLLHTRFAVPLVLPRTVTDYKQMFAAMGFSKESINNNRIHNCGFDGFFFEYRNDTETRRIEVSEYEKFGIQIQTECFAVKFKEIWKNNDEEYVYVDSNKIREYFPDTDKYTFVPVNNSLLSKAEIPFVLYEKNRGRCFLELS